MGTDPTRPTPPPASTLPPPEALAPVAAPPEALIVPGGWQIEGLPDIVLRAGTQAAERTVEFFTAQIRNPHTRAAYGTAVTRFFAWCDAITAYLLNGGTLERAQAIAAHESPRTTKLYDRTADEVTIEDIEKIGI